MLSLIPHFHKELEIVYVVKGSTVAFADNNHVEVKKGQIYISFPNQIHYYISSPDSEFRVFIVSANVFFGIEQLLHNNIPQNPLIETEPDEPVHTYCRKITELTENGDVSELTGYFNLLMARILKGVTLGPASLNVSSSLHEVLMFCANHYAEEITLDFVAQQMHLSRHHISRLFGKKLNIGFNDYINSFQIPGR